MTRADRFFSAQDKIAAYDHETRNLMLDAMDFDDAVNEHFTLPEIVYLLRESFKNPIVHKRVLGDEMDFANDPARGFCMVSSYWIYSMTGGDKVWELYGTPMHWWLYHKKTHSRFDITNTQFTPQQLQTYYIQGKNVKFLGKDQMFYDILSKKAHMLAQHAGIE